MEINIPATPATATPVIDCEEVSSTVEVFGLDDVQTIELPKKQYACPLAFRVAKWNNGTKMALTATTNKGKVFQTVLNPSDFAKIPSGTVVKCEFEYDDDGIQLGFVSSSKHPGEIRLNHAVTCVKVTAA